MADRADGDGPAAEPDPGPGGAADDGPGGGSAGASDSGAVLGGDVEHDREGWWVVLTVGFHDDVVRRRIGPYPTETRARLAADLIRRAADRDTPPHSGL